MEFLRFGSSIPGGYWGCCCGDIIQNFCYDPDEKGSIQIVDGDGGMPMGIRNGGLFAGPTYRDIFWQRFRFGTFSTRDMPNHFFIAVLTRYQCNSKLGKKWLAILKEAGFEFVRAVSNSVSSGNNLLQCEPDKDHESNVNYVFACFRNIGSGAVYNPFEPPKSWTDISGGVPEAVASITEPVALEKGQRAFHLSAWKKAGPAKLMTEKELEKAKVPIIYAGKRSPFPQQEKEVRLFTEKEVAEGKKVSHPDDLAIWDEDEDDYDDDIMECTDPSCACNSF